MHLSVDEVERSSIVHVQMQLDFDNNIEKAIVIIIQLQVHAYIPVQGLQ